MDRRPPPKAALPARQLGACRSPVAPPGGSRSCEGWVEIEGWEPGACVPQNPRSFRSFRTCKSSRGCPSCAVCWLEVTLVNHKAPFWRGFPPAACPCISLCAGITATVRAESVEMAAPDVAKSSHREKRGNKAFRGGSPCSRVGQAALWR